MKIDELFGSAADHVSNYIGLLVGIFSAPTQYIPPETIERVTTPSKSDIILPSSAQVEQRLSPRLIGFVLVSLFIGVTIWNVILPKDEQLSLETSVVVVTIFWLLIGTVGHGFCRLLRGHGTYLQTLSASLHISAAVHVVSTFLAVLFGGLLKIGVFPSYLGEIIQPPIIYFAIQLLLLSYYVPRTFAIVHGFRFTRRWLLFVLLLALPCIMTTSAIILFLSFACFGC